MEQLLLLTAEAANQDCIQEEKMKGKTSLFEPQSIRCENLNIFNFTVVHSNSISTILLKASEPVNPTVEVIILK